MTEQSLYGLKSFERYVVRFTHRRERMMTEGYAATLGATTLAISRSSLYYPKKPRGSRADRTYDEQIVMACVREVGVWLSAGRLVAVAKERSANRKRV